jgi:hypothetical protein
MNMTGRFLLLAALMGALILAPAGAGANFVNFDTYAPGNYDGKHLGPAPPEGFTLTASDGSAQIQDWFTPKWGYSTVPNVATNEDFITKASLTFTFDVPRGSVSFVGGDAGGDTDQFFVDAYDDNGNLMFTYDSGVFGGNPKDINGYMVDQAKFQFTGPGYIKKLVIRDAINYGIGIDDLEYCHPIPVPPTLLLLGSGLVGLLAFRRRA